LLNQNTIIKTNLSQAAIRHSVQNPVFLLTKAVGDEKSKVFFICNQNKNSAENDNER